MNFVKGFLITWFTLAAIIGLTWQFYLKEQVAFADVATAYGAKQVCSCRFIGERSLESCQGDFTQDVSLIRFSESPRAVQAEVLGGLIRATARFEPGLGCTLAHP